MISARLMCLFLSVGMFLITVFWTVFWIGPAIRGTNDRLDRLTTCMSGSGQASALVCAQQDRDGPAPTCAFADADLWTDDTWHCRPKPDPIGSVLLQVQGSTTGTIVPPALDTTTGGMGQLYISTQIGTNNSHGYAVTCGFSHPAPLSSGDSIFCQVQ